ncbi:hypothetical protein V6N11_053389 [Hibiscus sabdariffa]|uniref:Uncharacterized protein n=1 Tax=Hibiscus sabdariffa TaxID=183260 RepID=A0ABR2UCV4_9ROSI
MAIESPAVHASTNGAANPGHNHEDGVGKQQDSSVNYVQCLGAPAQVYNHVFQPVHQQLPVQQQLHGFSQYGHRHNFPHPQQFSYYPVQGANSLSDVMTGFFSPVSSQHGFVSMVPSSATSGGCNSFSSVDGYVVAPLAPISSSGGTISQGTSPAA